MNAMKAIGQQRGMALTTLLAGAVVLIFLAIAGMKVVPPYMENGEIKGMLKNIANDPAMQGADIYTIRDSYEKRATINSISAITSNQINIDTTHDKPVLSVHYQVKIPIAGNASLLLDFNDSSAN